MDIDDVSYPGPAAYILHSKHTPLYYIGSTVNLKQRLATHNSYIKTESHSNPKITELYEKSKGDILVTYVKTHNKDAAYDKEQEYLDLYGKGEYCCNMSLQARPSFDYLPLDDPEYRKSISERMKGKQNKLGYKTPDVTKEKQSKGIKAAYALNPRSQEAVAKWRESMKDYVPSEEAKANWRAASQRKVGVKRDPSVGKKVSEARMGMKFSEEHKRNLQKKRINPIVVDGVEYPNIPEAKRVLGLTKGQLSNLMGWTEKKTLRVSIDGVIYEKMSDAQKALGLTKRTLQWRLHKDSYPNYVILNQKASNAG